MEGPMREINQRDPVDLKDKAIYAWLRSGVAENKTTGSLWSVAVVLWVNRRADGCRGSAAIFLCSFMLNWYTRPHSGNNPPSHSHSLNMSRPFSHSAILVGFLSGSVCSVQPTVSISACRSRENSLPPSLQYLVDSCCKDVACVLWNLIVLWSCHGMHCN